MISGFLRSVSFAIGVGLSVAAFGQANPPGGASTPPTSLTAADLNFAKEAAIGEHLEVDAGRIAERSSNNPQVKEFGARMVRDHSAAGAQLKEIAAAKGVTLPQGLDAKHQKVLDHLASLRGGEFDREYMRKMVEDHDEAVKLFENAARSASDPQIKRFAAETSRTIQDHDKSAHEIAASMATGSSRPSTR